MTFSPPTSALDFSERFERVAAEVMPLDAFFPKLASSSSSVTDRRKVRGSRPMTQEERRSATLAACVRSRKNAAVTRNVFVEIVKPAPLIDAFLRTCTAHERARVGRIAFTLLVKVGLIDCPYADELMLDSYAREAVRPGPDGRLQIRDFEILPIHAAGLESASNLRNGQKDLFLRQIACVRLNDPGGDRGRYNFTLGALEEHVPEVRRAITYGLHVVRGCKLSVDNEVFSLHDFEREMLADATPVCAPRNVLL